MSEERWEGDSCPHHKRLNLNLKAKPRLWRFLHPCFRDFVDLAEDLGSVGNVALSSGKPTDASTWSCGKSAWPPSPVNGPVAGDPTVAGIKDLEWIHPVFEDAGSMICTHSESRAATSASAPHARFQLLRRRPKGRCARWPPKLLSHVLFGDSRELGLYRSFRQGRARRK